MCQAISIARVIKMSRQLFIDKIAPLILKHDSPLLPSIRIAQACLESADGTSLLATGANNFFGIKASEPWVGVPAYIESYEEDSSGIKTLVKSGFRRYEDMEASVKDHASFVISTDYRKNYYAKAINATTFVGQAAGLTGTYATDSQYGAKLIKIIEQYDLEKYDKKESVKMAYIGLDIGHGSNTYSSGGGKGVATGGKIYEEHNFNSIVAKKLKGLLEKSGHKVTYGVQQPNSADQSLRARTNQFNALKVDIMVSIHANWIGTFKNSTNGIGAFYANYSLSTRSTKSKKLADLIMAEYRKQGQSIYGAGSIPSVLSNWTNFHMTREVSMPAVLMELGFMSGTTDFDKIFGSQQDKYTTQMAEGMAKGINAYFGVSESATNVVSSDFDLPTHKEPVKPFKELKVGDLATIRKPHDVWYIPQTNKGRKPSKDFTGQSFKIMKVIDCEVGYSKRAYLLDGVISYVLEQDVVEARSDWDSESKDQQEQLDYVYIDGVKRAIGDVIE